MRANPADDHHACVVGHLDFESVPVSFNVEDYDVPRQETCRCVKALDVLRREPSGRLGIGNPDLDPWTGIGMYAGKLIELFAPDN